MEHRGDSCMARVECLHDLRPQVRWDEGSVTTEDNPITLHRVQAIREVWCEILWPLLQAGWEASMDE